jgi:hypothetical protein
MKANPIRILLMSNVPEDVAIFARSLASIKIPNTFKHMNNADALRSQLFDFSVPLPHLVFMYCSEDAAHVIEGLRTEGHLSEVTLVVFGRGISEDEFCDCLIAGANIYFKAPEEPGEFTRALHHIIMVDWQYQTSGLSRDNYLMQV